MIGQDGKSNQSVFNQAYKNGLNNYIKNHNSCPTNVKGWLKDIIKNIQI
jgi:hypothetical protein